MFAGIILYYCIILEIGGMNNLKHWSRINMLHFFGIQINMSF